MSPAVRQTMTRNLIDLVYMEASEHFDAIEVQGTIVRFHRRQESAFSVAALAAAVRGDSVVSAAPNAEGVDVEYVHTQAAARASLDDFMLELGPYRTVESTRDHLRLERRSASGSVRGPFAIDVKSIPEAEEWRRFLAREFDLVSFVSPRHAQYLGEVPSVRLVPIANPDTIGLYFSFASGRALDTRLRRAIALGLRRAPLAAALGESTAVAAQVSEDEQSARALLGEIGIDRENTHRLEVVLYAEHTQFAETALAIDLQLASLGIDCDLVQVALPELIERMRSSEFDALLFYGSLERDSWHRFHAGPRNIGNFTSAELDSAIDRDDAAGVRGILERDVPFTPLFRIEESVAVSRGLCGVHPQRTSDFRWLMDVHRCLPGEDE